MLEQIKKLQQPLCAVLLNKPREVHLFSPDGDEWTVIEELLDIFHKTMSASLYPTLSMFKLTSVSA